LLPVLGEAPGTIGLDLTDGVASCSLPVSVGGTAASTGGQIEQTVNIGDSVEFRVEKDPESGKNKACIKIVRGDGTKPVGQALSTGSQPIRVFSASSFATSKSFGDAVLQDCDEEESGYGSSDPDTPRTGRDVNTISTNGDEVSFLLGDAALEDIYPAVAFAGITDTPVASSSRRLASNLARRPEVSTCWATSAQGAVFFQSFLSLTCLIGYGYCMYRTEPSEYMTGTSNILRWACFFFPRVGTMSEEEEQD